jgi:tetratricopeptide (TPR) repeat protein
LKNYKSSTEYYEKAFALDSNYTIEYKLPYSINLAGMGEFEKALAAINDLFEKKPPKNSTTYKAAEYRKRSYEFAVNYAKKNANRNYVFSPQNIGTSINTSESEYFPSLTIDGKEMVFTRENKKFQRRFLL